MREKQTNIYILPLIFFVMLLSAVLAEGGIKNLTNLSVVIQTVIIYIVIVKLGMWSMNKLLSHENKNHEGRR